MNSPSVSTHWWMPHLELEKKMSKFCYKMTVYLSSIKALTKGFHEFSISYWILHLLFWTIFSNDCSYKSLQSLRKIIKKSSQSHPGWRSDSSARPMRLSRFESFKCPISGHLTTTWTKVYPILNSPPPWEEKNEDFTYNLPFITQPPWTFYWPSPPSSCTRSYWLPPNWLFKWGKILGKEPFLRKFKQIWECCNF